MTEQIIPQEQIDKSENRKTTRLRNQPRKNYKIFIPQSKILKKWNFKSNFNIILHYLETFETFFIYIFQNNMLTSTQ